MEHTMKQLLKKRTSILEKLKLILPPLLLIIGNIFLFGPGTIIAGNIPEIEVGLLDIMIYYALPSLIILAILLFAGLILTEKKLSVYLAFFSAVGILLWIQGNILVWDFGLIGKGDMRWGVHTWRGWVDSSIWILILTLCVFFHKKIFKIRAFAVIALLMAQCLYLGVSSVQKPGIWKSNYSPQLVAPKEIFEFSTKQNVIHVILDEFQSTVFQKIIDENPGKYRQILEGFTFFKNTTGTFPTTLMSIPAIVSEKIYQNDVPINDFLKSVYKGQTISNTLFSNGYDVDVVASKWTDWHMMGQYSNFFSIPVPYGGTLQQHNRQNARGILKLVLFRHVPYFFKKAVYLEQSQSIPHQKDQANWEASRHFANKAFLQDLIDNMSIARDKPVYKFIHLTTTHWPSVLNKNCMYAGQIQEWNWENILIQSKCSFDHFLEFIQKLKTLGIYNSALIILHADHGYWVVQNSSKQIELKNPDWVLDNYVHNNKEYFSEIVCSALPMMTIKLPNSNGPLKTSMSPVVLSDIPATVYSLLDIPVKSNGRNILNISENEIRERIFQYYDYAGLNRPGESYFDKLDKFIIKGDPLDKTSWTFLSQNIAESVFLVKKIDMGASEANRFLRSGWSSNEGKNKEGLTYRWAIGNNSSIFISIPKDKAMRLTAKVKTLPFPSPQTISVKINGKEVGTWTLTPGSWNFNEPWPWDTHSVNIAPDEKRPGALLVEFGFLHYKKDDKYDSRPLAVLFSSIEISEVEKN